MLRRTMLAAPLALLAACGRDSKISREEGHDLDVERLRREIPEIAKRCEPGVLGVAIGASRGGDLYTFNAARSFPMGSVFKAMLGAAVLSESEAGQFALSETVEVRDIDLSPGHSPVADAWPATTRYTLDDLLKRTVSDSDNTAADILLKRIGGPGMLTAWLESKGSEGLRVDRYEREMQPESVGLASFRAAWKGEAFVQAMTSVPDERKREAADAFLIDPRDTATPSGMMNWLDGLAAGLLLSPAATTRLLKMMTETPRASGRLAAATPAGAELAHKPGTGWTVLGRNLATNDVGVYTLKDGRQLTVVAFLAGATLDETGRDKAIADVGRAAIAALR
ncbi:MAG: hypothetical protein BGN86_16875 [Caulobacterales bacterium 68-7]|nr:MAG: hypothetical protein BGN86_16875 [Caulobacterales bacterium 68-7]